MEIKDLPAERQSVAELAIKALSTGLCLNLEYNGEGRIVEVHAVGTTTKGKPAMRVFQVLGGSNFSDTSGWKMMSLENVDNVHLLDTVSQGPRPGYKPGDKGMGAILAEIPDAGPELEQAAS